jgi:hypothetical protein
MVSVFSKTLFFLLILTIITNSIHGYYLTQLQAGSQGQSNTNDDISSNHQINLRSVLWPKICFRALMKKNQHENLHHIVKRRARKCYPFDTV